MQATAKICKEKSPVTGEGDEGRGVRKNAHKMRKEKNEGVTD